MGPVDEFIQQIGARAIRAGSLILVDRRAALAILDLCAKEEIRAFGVDGFHIKGDKVLPDMGVIGDFSNAGSVGTSVRDARSLICSIESTELWFELTLDDNKSGEGN